MYKFKSENDKKEFEKIIAEVESSDVNLSLDGMIEFLQKKNTPESLALMNLISDYDRSDAGVEPIDDVELDATFNANELEAAVDYLATAHIQRGDSKSLLEDYNGSIADYTKAIEIDPNNGVAYSNRGVSKLRLEDYNGAIEDFTKAIKIDPTNDRAFGNRGNASLRLEDYNGAIEDFTKAIELNPSDADTCRNRGTAKYILEDYNGAIADHTKAIELDPNDAVVYLFRGLSKANLENHDEAILDYTKAIEIDPNSAIAYYGRGNSKYFLEDLTGGCKDAQKAEELGYGDNASKLINEVCGKEEWINIIEKRVERIKESIIDDLAEDDSQRIVNKIESEKLNKTLGVLNEKHQLIVTAIFLILCLLFLIFG